jgi:hypothetical protein
MVDVNNPKVLLLQHSKRCVRLILEAVRDGNVGEDELDTLRFRLDWIINMMTRSACSLQIDNELLQTLIHAANLLGEADKDIYHCYRIGRIFSGERGRPKYNISREQLELYLHYGFSLSKISEMLFVSTKTVSRRIEEFNIKSMAFSDLSNEDLDTVVSEIMREFPNCGSKRMSGFLLARGLRIQQARVREALRRTDPDGVLLRSLQLRTIARRRYNVKSPLSLWHLDGHHKLIR